MDHIFFTALTQSLPPLRVGFTNHGVRAGLGSLPFLRLLLIGVAGARARQGPIIREAE